jgi:hypothetical protein
MEPLYVNPDWFEKHWYSPEAPERTWRAPAALATVAAAMIAALLTPPSVVSHRLSPPFARTEMVAQFSGTAGDPRSQNVCFDFGRELCPYGR